MTEHTYLASHSFDKKISGPRHDPCYAFSQSAMKVF